ncbi:MAG: dipeptide epimerase [Ponticaulis sp.]|nr:dipeptide epimerase [Ponticaulis sp.]
MTRFSDPLEALAGLPPVSASDVRAEAWTLKQPFIIARGREESITVVVVSLTADGKTGQGESCPVFHYGETVESVMSQVRQMLAALEAGNTWPTVHDDFSPGAARNAVDCAIWDLAAKTTGRRVHEMLGMSPLKTVETFYTLSVDTPERMAAAAERAERHSHLKLKLGGSVEDGARVEAVRKVAAGKTLIVDVNEYWSMDMLRQLMPLMISNRVAMIEQPLKAGQDAELKDFVSELPLCADESCHVTQDLERLKDDYRFVNIKLDKTGGLTEAVRLQRQANAYGLKTMVGCMLGTSLAMAPSHLIAQQAEYVDLDAPLLIGSDRRTALRYLDGRVSPPESELWG